MKSQYVCIFLMASLLLTALPFAILASAGPDPADQDRSFAGTGTTSMSGPWYIDSGDDLSYSNQTITVTTGNVQINATGRLTLENAVLKILSGKLLLMAGGTMELRQGSVLNVTGNIEMDGGSALLLRNSTCQLNCPNSNGEYKIWAKRFALIDASNSTFTKVSGKNMFKFDCYGNISLVDCKVLYTSTAPVLTMYSGLMLKGTTGTEPAYPMFAKITRCEFSKGALAAITVCRRMYTQITNCYVHDQPRGIETMDPYSPSGLVIDRNRIENITGLGISITYDFSDKTTSGGSITNNTIRSCTTGIRFAAGGSSVGYSYNLKGTMFAKNTITQCSSYGMHLDGQALVEVSFKSNDISGCKVGLNLSSQLSIENSTISGNSQYNLMLGSFASSIGYVRSLNSIIDLTKAWMAPGCYVDRYWYLNLSITGGGAPQGGASVVVKDAFSNQVFSGTTSGTGRIELVLVYEGKFNSTSVSYTPHNITASKAGYLNAYATVVVDRQTEAALDLKPNDPPSAPANLCPARTHSTTPGISWDPAADPNGHSVSYKVNIFDGADQGGARLVSNLTVAQNWYNVTYPLQYFHSYLVRVYAVDSFTPPGVSWTEMVMQVENTPPSRPEAAFAKASPGPSDDLVLNLTTPSSDPDTDPADLITYTYSILRNGLPLMLANSAAQVNTTSRSLVIPAAETEAGDMFQVAVTAYDGINGSEQAVASVLVVNHAPAVQAQLPDVEMEEDSSVFVSLAGVFTDVDAQELILSETSSDDIMLTFQPNDTLEIRPKKDWNGQETIVIAANDSISEAHQEITVIVSPVNDGPVCRNFSAQREMGSPCNYTFTAREVVDVDGDALTYTWDFGDGTEGEGLAVTHSYIQLESQVEYTVLLTITDGFLSDSAWQKATVLAKEPEIKDNGTATADDDDDEELPIEDNGTDDDEATADDDIAPSKAPADKKGGLDPLFVFIPVIIIVLLIAAVIVVLVIVRRSKGGKDTAQAPQPLPAQPAPPLDPAPEAPMPLDPPPYILVPRTSAPAPAVQMYPAMEPITPTPIYPAPGPLAAEPMITETSLPQQELQQAPQTVAAPEDGSSALQ